MAKRVFNSDFWKDVRTIDNFSVEDKYFWLYLLTNPHTNTLGIYKLPIKTAAFESGYSVETIKTLLKRFEKTYDLIRYNAVTGEIAIKDFLKDNIDKGGKPMEDALMKNVDEVEDRRLLKFVYMYISQLDELNLSVQAVLDYIADNYNMTADGGFTMPEIEEVAEIPEAVSEVVDDNTFITFPLAGQKKEHKVTFDDIREWESLYPAVDVQQECRKMRGWLLYNPTRRKTKKGIGRFINYWLSNAQDSAKSSYGKQAPTMAYDETAVKEELADFADTLNTMRAVAKR